MRYSIPYVFIICLIFSSCKSSTSKTPEPETVTEQYRPQVHFTPKSKWMNDPNGMVYFNDRYHLFYQHYPDSTIWGPMHWGHASSTDLVNWEHHPIALYPDSLGYIFSGSAVVDVSNSSGFGQDGKPPLVAIFTHHDPKGEHEGKTNYQNQSIAYSVDEGKTWTKYAGNPVLKNPGVKDFRDPKVSWHPAKQKWIMTLAVQDRISFYSSPDLKTWTKESDFGQGIGAHGGVWECPDLFPLTYRGDSIWILLVSINPGGPNGGSATQYFTGQFDGGKFIPNDTSTRWVDYGPDNYAGVTWSNTGARKIFMGWMSNWQYANQVPTKSWRSAMTIPRELLLVDAGGRYALVSKPVSEFDALTVNTASLENISVKGEYDLSASIKTSSSVARLDLKIDDLDDFSIKLSNGEGELVEVGYDKAANRYYIDRSKSGETGFEKGFAGRHFASRLYPSKTANLTLVCDHTSIELFADNGLTVMTSIFFPGTPMTNYSISSVNGIRIRELVYSELKPAVIQ